VTDARTSATPRVLGDGGTSLLTASLALTIFLVFLLFAVQLLVNLYEGSVVTDVAFDGAHQVASHRVDHDDPAAVERARLHAEDKMRALLGPQGQRATFDWSQSDDEQVALRLQLDTPHFEIAGFGRALPFNHIDRTARVRVEVLR
jgi:hypothetical protein